MTRVWGPGVVGAHKEKPDREPLDVWRADGVTRKDTKEIWWSGHRTRKETELVGVHGQKMNWVGDG